MIDKNRTKRHQVATVRKREGMSLSRVVKKTATQSENRIFRGDKQVDRLPKRDGHGGIEGYTPESNNSRNQLTARLDVAMLLQHLDFLPFRRWIVLTVTVFAFAQTAFAEGTESQTKAKPDVWIVSTRHAPVCRPSVDTVNCLRYWHYGPNGSWQPSNVKALLSTDAPDVRTLIYVHENRVSKQESFQRSRQLAERIARLSPHVKKFRLITISWPADRIGWRPRPDAQIKAQRSQAHAYYLAWLIDQMAPDTPLSIFGMSYGPRMISTALHLLGGGEVSGQSPLIRHHPERQPVRVALLAPALGRDWLIPGQRLGQATSQIEHLLVMINPSDEVLRWYPKLYHHRGPQALGYLGFRGNAISEPIQSRITEYNVSHLTGRSHSWRVYEGSNRVLSLIVPHLFDQRVDRRGSD